ncbi:hypothetical protein [Mongoliitalea daihaiensis]|uniref:hypothetical protein n=1 Tax=Mongoliitalea daihaiensis TaxID=2782006 RepID=UPI001F2B880B|nr:hypothetical protein [Mongoliitalea daihaiensis]UJP64885.1 hypothetical protein IPZ59_19170 [Mongoliitalea daihaiensis]
MKKNYSCYDCGIDTKKGKTNFFTVTDELWEKHGVGKGFLCLSCFQKRLGRDFKKEDFLVSFLNYLANPVTKKIINPTNEEMNSILEKFNYQD